MNYSACLQKRWAFFYALLCVDVMPLDMTVALIQHFLDGSILSSTGSSTWSMCQKTQCKDGKEQGMYFKFLETSFKKLSNHEGSNEFMKVFDKHSPESTMHLQSK